MANFHASAVDKKPLIRAAYGNVACAYAKVTMPVGTAAADISNVLRLPKDIRIIDFYESHNGDNSAATTANFGLAAVAGGPTTFVDADYFLAAADLNAAGRNRWGNVTVGPVQLDGDYYLQIVIAGTTSATLPMDIHVHVLYEYLGNL